MIFGHIQHTESSFGWLPAPLKTVLAHLKATDFSALPAANYDLQGKDIYVQVIDTTTKPWAEARPEVHRTYVDVQFLWRGRERIGVASDNGRNEVGEDLLADKDVLFYRAADDELVVDMRPGSFAVFFPTDVHRTVCQVDGPEAIRKVVVKVRASLLNGN